MIEGCERGERALKGAVEKRTRDGEESKKKRVEHCRVVITIQCRHVVNALIVVICEMHTCSAH